MSDAGILDFAGLDSAAAEVSPAADSSEQVVTSSEGGEQQVETPAEGVSSETGDEEGSKKTVEAASKDELPGDKTTPDSIRKTLKAIKDSDPTSAAAVKELHGAYERWNAAKAIFPTVQAMKDAKAVLDLVGGQEGYDKLAEMKTSIDSVDQKLYEGDISLVDDIISDLKSENKMEAFGKLAPAFFDKLKEVNENVYYDALTPHFIGALEQTNIPGVFSAMTNALASLKDDSKPEEIKAAIQKALGVAQRASQWFDKLKSDNEQKKASVVSPEEQKLKKEREEFKKQQEEFKTNQTKEFKNSVASVQEKMNNQVLGTALKDYLKMPFFKGFPRETLMDLGAGIKARLYETLTADRTYQAQMKAYWGEKNPNRAKIEEYHKTKLESIAQDIVRQKIQERYPNFTKGGSAAGRVAAATAKKDMDNKVAAASTASGKPIYVASKPKDIVRNETITVGDMTIKPPDLVMLEIAGKGYLRMTNGGYKFVTWRR